MQLECRSGKKNKKFSNVNILDFAEKLETILERVKELTCLCHLVEPIETAVAKLKELNVRIENSCNQYGDCGCPNQDGGKIQELTCAKGPPAERKSIQESPSSCGSCACSSCHCGSSRGSVVAGELEPNLHKTETYCIKDPPKCSPCRCGVDANGKSIKSRDCKQAIRARRESREARACEARPRTADAKLTSVMDSEIVVLGATVSQTLIKVEASWPEKTFKFTKEDTLLEPSSAIERAILCNISSDSSSEDSSRSSCDNTCPLLNYKQREEEACLANMHSRNSYKNSNIYDSDSYLDACGCDRTVGDNACPCGCGNLMELPEETREPRSHCRCENCGKEITEGDQDGATCSLNNRDRRGSGQKSVGNSRCGKVQEDSRTADIQKYIEDLEEQCRKKDNIITQLQDQLINLNDGCC